MESRRNPVLLLHGLSDSTLLLYPLAAVLRARRWEVHSFPFRRDFAPEGIESCSRELHEYAAAAFSGRRFDIVGFSMGGIAARYYLQRLGGIDRVERFITVGSPHKGTLVAHLSPTKGVEQMRPGSDFLKDLDRDAEVLSHIATTSIYSSIDLLVIPAQSGMLSTGRNVEIHSFLHFAMAMDPNCISEIITALELPAH